MKIFKSVSVVASVSFALGLIIPMTALAASPSAVSLGTAGDYAILAKTGVSTTGATSVVGNIGLSPAAASYITGFDLILPAAGAYSTSALVTGKVYAPGYADPTPANLTTAVLDMQNAYTDAAGRAADTTELGAGNIGGLTLVSGVYKWGTGVTIPTDVTLSGSANDIWIFEIGQNLDISSATKVVLAGGAQAKNIFWQVAGQATLGTTAVMNGNILGQTAIVMNTGAVLNGRALAQTAVTLDASTVTAPTSSASTPAPATSATPATPSSSTSSDTSATPATSATPSANATSANSASGLTAPQIQAILEVLASFNADASVIANVRASLGGTTTGSVTSAAVHAFQANLTVGSLGSEVKALQEYLNAHGYTVANSGAGSPGNETTTFGAATRAALVKYQQAKGITPAVGYFGTLTRASVNASE
ncbi:MAG: ice-binding family protein [Candidatus Parcubacteria bacterium]|nr:ice-binding family protein [Candidatus Parcubacteria bacterium]